MKGKFELRSMRVDELEAMPINPRQISQTARAGLKKSLERFGLVQPVVWNKRSGHVVGGHQRLTVLKEKGLIETEVLVVDLGESDEKALNLTLNNPHIAGDFTEDLGGMIAQLRAEIPEWVENLEIGALDPAWDEQDDAVLELFDAEPAERGIWIMITTDEPCAAKIESLLKSELEGHDYRLERSDIR